jgi:hypothetical protein
VRFLTDDIAIAAYKVNENVVMDGKRFRSGERFVGAGAARWEWRALHTESSPVIRSGARNRDR